MKPLPIFYLFFVLLFIGCKSDDDGEIKLPIDPESNLVSATKISELSIADVSQSFDLIFSTNELSALKSNLNAVTAYKIIYETQHPFSPNVQIQASGLLLIPDSEDALPVLSLQHGTILDPNEVPSSFVATSVNKHYTSILAGLDYIVAVPDYLGYGETNYLLHPYEHGETLAQSSFDMLEAVQSFLDEQSVLYNEKLFLAGYSEGGYATMALHQYIEENTNTTVTASIAAGGAYNKTLFAKEIMQKNEPLAFIPNYLWVIYTYNNLHNVNEPFSFYLNEPYASMITDNPLSLFNLNINTNPQILFTENFRNLIINEGDHPIIDAIKDNDRFDWKPKGLVYILHGENDDFVFPSNATSAYEAMMTEGSTNINLILKEGQDHTQTAVEFSVQVPLIFESLR